MPRASHAPDSAGEHLVLVVSALSPSISAVWFPVIAPTSQPCLGSFSDIIRQDLRVACLYDGFSIIHVGVHMYGVCVDAFLYEYRAHVFACILCVQKAYLTYLVYIQGIYKGYVVCVHAGLCAVCAVLCVLQHVCMYVLCCMCMHAVLYAECVPVCAHVL